MEFHGRETSPPPMNFHVEGVNGVVNLVSLRFLGFGQHFCFIWCGDDMLVRWDLTGEKISDALSEMEHLSFEVLHQREWISVRTVRQTNRVLIKAAGKCE